MKDLDRSAVRDLMTDGAQIVEVLGAEEYEEDHLPGAVNIPLRRIHADAPTRLEKSSPVVVYCWDSA